MSAPIAPLRTVLLAVEAGRSVKTLERAALPHEPGILKVSAVSWGDFDAAAAKAVSRDYVPASNHRIKRGDLIFSRANTIDLTGAVAIADDDYPNRFLSDKLLRLVVDQTRADPEYLLFALRSPVARAHIERNAAGTSNSMRNIAQPAILDTPVLLPPIEEQRGLAARLSLWFRDASRAAGACRDQLDLSEALLTGSLWEGFRHSLIATSSDVARYKADWSWVSLQRLARLESGHTPSRRHPEWWNGSIPWLALPDIRRLHGKFAYETTETINDAGLANSSARLLPVGTVCVSRTASIGFVTILGRPMATSQDFCNWVCDPNKLDPEFLMYAFMTSQDYLRELGSGAVHKTIYMPTIQSFHICAPDIEEQRRIARTLRERLAAAEDLVARLRARLAEIELLPQRLLASVFGSPS